MEGIRYWNNSAWMRNKEKEMEREKLLETGKQLAGQIYEKMGMIEQCTTIADAVKELPVCFVDGDGKLIRMEKVLSNEQMNDIRDLAIKTIIENSREAEIWLERLNDATNEPVAEENPECEKDDETQCGVPVIETEELVEEPVIEMNDTTEEKEVEEEKPLSSTQSGKQKKRKKKDTEPEKESISDIQKKAADLGMTYGQYMQEQEKKSVTVKKRGRKPNYVVVVKKLKVCWVSAGISSFMAGVLAGGIDEWIYIDIADQHPDSLRFNTE